MRNLLIIGAVAALVYWYVNRKPDYNSAFNEAHGIS